MKDLYVRVTIIVVSLCFAKTATNPSRKSRISLNSEFPWDRYLLANSWSTTHSPQTADTVDMSFHFFQVLFQSHTKKEWQIRHLDLSNHRIWKMTLRPLAHLHALETLNLSNNAIHSFSLDLPPPSQQERHRCGSHRRLPRVKVLILQRNRLSATPKGEHF